MTIDNNRRLHRRLEVIGAIFVCICAPLLHFAYAWSGNNFAVGLFAAVNESVWEHTKLIYFPMLLYSIVEFAIVKPDFKRFFAAKALALAFASFSTVSFFYTYSGAFGVEVLALDVASTFVWTALAFVISYKLYYSKYRLQRYFVPICVLFLAQLAVQVLFTPFAPSIPLFQDHSG